MGGHMSKNPGETSAAIDNLQCKIELNSYEDACRVDTDLQSFDTNLQARNNHVINTL
uniref:Uncharacterized protein n=1 Tax=Solanum lycopersicum TaxID=4081 RepID=A0A3Q7ECE2_SOLLC